MTDTSSFKSVDQFRIHQNFTASTEGEEILDLSNIPRQFVSIAGKIFDWRETVVTNVEQMAAMAAKSLGYDVRIQSNLCAVIILANTEWAAQHIWGAEISVPYRKIVSKYRYNQVHDAESIRKKLRILATADVMQDQRKDKAPGELSDMVSKGMTRLKHMVQQQIEPPPYQLDSDKDSTHAAITTYRKGSKPQRRWQKRKKKKGDTVAVPHPCPCPDHHPTPQDEKEPHPAGHAAARVGDGKRTKKIRKIRQVASIEPSKEETASPTDCQTTSNTPNAIKTRSGQGRDLSGSARKSELISRSMTSALNDGVGIVTRQREIRTHGRRYVRELD